MLCLSFAGGPWAGMLAAAFPVTADEKTKNGHDPRRSCPSQIRLKRLRLYCAAWPLPCPLPLPRTGMVAPVLFMMKLNSSCGVMSLLVAISMKMLSGFGSP